MSKSVDVRNLTPEQRDAVRRYALVIEWSDEDEHFLAVAPDLPGLVTHGRTRAEAAEMGEEAIALWLHGRQSLPVPSFTALPDHLRSAPNLAGARRSA
jgi:antitoxin HicB